MLLTELYGIPNQLSVLDHVKMMKMRKEQKEKTRKDRKRETVRTAST